MFRRFDYGTKKNMKYYGQADPPEYDLGKITANTYMYYGLDDSSTVPEDVKRLPALMPNIKLFHEIDDPTWGHLDFIFANQVKKVINDKVIGFCLDYEIIEQS